MKKGFRGLACLLALAVLLLALPTGASAASWTADISGSSGTITNGSAVLRVKKDDFITYLLFITGVDASSGPLGDLVIPSNVDFYQMYTISPGAFQNNDTLTSITLSNTAIVSIQARAFQKCANLVRADLSECTMTNVNTELFEDCTSLETVILPLTIKNIYEKAFNGCNSLNTIYILSEDVIDLYNANAFAGCPDDMKIVIVNGNVEEYKNAGGWSAYANKIVGGSLLTASPASKAWTVQRGEQSQPTTFTLKNENGNNAVDRNNLSVTLAGTNADAFTLDATGMAGSLSVGGTTTFTVTPNTNLSTGTYTAHVQVKSGDVIYASIPLTLTVEGAPLTGAQVQVSGSYTYNGTAQQPSGSNVTVTLNGNTLTEGDDYTLSYSDNTNAGEATVTVTGKDDYSGTATGTFTIQPATLTVTGAELSPKTYDGTTNATVKSVAFGGLVNNETLVSGTDYTATAAFDSIEAGTGYTATVTVTLKNDNYTFADGKTAEYELTDQTIAPCPVTVTPNDVSKKYGQSDPALTYTVSGLASGDSLTGELSRDAGEDAGSYAITQGTLAASGNYTLSFVDNINLTIEKANVTLSVTVAPASQKAGNPVTVTVTAENAETGLMASGWTQPDGTVTVMVDGTSVPMTRSGDAWTGTYDIPANARAGEKTVSATYNGNTNYNTKIDSATLTVNDKGAVTLTLTPSASSVTYGDSVTLTAAVAKADPGDQDALTGTVQFYLDGTTDADKVGEPQDVTGALSVTLDRAKLTAGDHIVYAVYGGNSAFATAQADVGIKVAPLTLAWDASELTASRSQAQDGEATVYGTLRVTGALEGDSVTLTPNTGLVTSGLDNITQPGQYQVRVVPANGSYSLSNQNYALPDEGPMITAAIHASTEEDVSGTGGKHLKITVEEGLSAVPDAIRDEYANPAALEAALRTDVTALGVPGENVAVYDVTLMVSKDGGQSWTEATESDFPASGITVTVPYPAGTGAQGYTFAVAHMFASGTHAGEIEHPQATATEKGVAFTVTGLSPVAVGWTADSYTVKLNPNGGTITQGKDVTAYTYGVGATLPTAADVTRDLYTFAGWYASEDLTGSPVTAIGATDAGNREYWAKWDLIPGDPPVFTEPSGPKEVAVQPGAQATLTAAATNATTCQWYINRNDDAGYVKLSGATAMTYTTSPVTLDNDGYTYYCEATNLYGTARSAVLTLRVSEAVPPQTGDSSHTGLWLALLLLSLGGLFAAGYAARRRYGR